MKKEPLDHLQNQDNTNLNTKGKEQLLEISSTGYGLESVSQINSKKLQPKLKSSDGNSSCGGL
ncbi:hypothetical protein [Neobacillus mesonae]|uniref:hypothetical protein n=1 Tax=Neobacillus mesonae TaxID=1193713 RepID=UPI00203F481F|nr:hypothetical protein [Neobacillus mesonae]MCM3569324.1 hypothetical protein [Neobacillus mesonae]